MKQFFIFCIAISSTLMVRAQNSINVQETPDTIAYRAAANESGITSVPSHVTPSVKFPSPYKTKFGTDAPVIVAGVGLTALGVHLIQNKDPLPEDKLNTLSKSDLPFFDRGNAGYYDESMDKASYIPFQASFAMPVALMLINKNERQHAGQVLVMYTETMAITGALFTLSAGLIDRPRPFVYGTKAPLNKKVDPDSQRSFFAGHTAATAAATFFMAKVFSDFNPDSKARPYVWAFAATLPAVVGYMRYEAGHHFLSDNIVGYGIGAAAGILVPKFHKVKAFKNVSVAPYVGEKYRGLTLTYRIAPMTSK
jgi:membrane-associated phospholipid phosphatase